MQFYPPGQYDDKTLGFTGIHAVPLASAMGAEIRGVDLALLSEKQFDEIKRALFRFKMIYFRNQTISPAEQEALTLRFGNFGVDAYTRGMEGYQNIQRLIKEATTVVPRVFGETWHTDSPFLPRPPSISLLYGLEVPPYGGDTWWSNTELAYEFLSEGMKKLLAPLRVHMSGREVIRNTVVSTEQGRKKVGEIEITMDQNHIVEGNFHPLVRTHPETGKKSLYVDHAYSLGIHGLDDEEAAAILGYLKRHVAREIFTCRLHWENRTFVIWDNRSVIHYAFNDYDGYRREMFRTIVEGEVPV
jgi:taurine dioxygenase